jgi:hypothetical protein
VELYQVDPIRDPRWSRFLQGYSRASAFHTAAWHEALSRTYAYESIAYTTSPPHEEIRNGLTFSKVHSWLTGRRLVSSPFADHCEPLFDSASELEFLMQRLQVYTNQQELKYVEIRPINGDFHSGEEPHFRPARRYYLHRIDLRPNLDEIRQGFDGSSVRRRVRRAERIGLVEKCGRSNGLLKDFYGLMVLTRARHAVPPQPYEWFVNLIECFGDMIEIRLAYKGNTPIAAVLILRFKGTALYKYGCSDANYNNFGGMPFLLWRAIEEAKYTNAQEFDLGRSDADNAGLIAFKNHWTTNCKPLIYWRFPGPISPESAAGWKEKILKRVFAHFPKSWLVTTGRLIYRHLG